MRLIKVITITMFLSMIAFAEDYECKSDLKFCSPTPSLLAALDNLQFCTAENEIKLTDYALRNITYRVTAINTGNPCVCVTKTFDIQECYCQQIDSDKFYNNLKIFLGYIVHAIGSLRISVRDDEILHEQMRRADAIEISKGNKVPKRSREILLSENGKQVFQLYDIRTTVCDLLGQNFINSEEGYYCTHDRNPNSYASSQSTPEFPEHETNR